MTNDSAIDGPTFIGIGAQRAGTSWLFDCLLEHPEVFMPQKEVHYFDNLYKTHDISWYKNLFLNKGENQISGEITPDYMYHRETIQGIYNNFPETKIIIILRKPIERSYSAFNLFKSHGRFKNMTFEEALKAEPFLLEQSLYFKQLENVYRYFCKDQVLIKLYEDIAENPIELYKSVCSFLQIDTEFQPNSLKTIKNSSAMSSAQSTLNIPAIQAKLENSFLRKYFKAFKATKLAQIIKKRLSQRKVSNDLITENGLKKKIFEDIDALEVLLNTSFDKWKS